jgi:hypothetical protein
MKKIYLVAVFIIGISVFSFILFYLWGITHILDLKPPIVIEKIDIGGQIDIQILYVPGNATLMNGVQIRKINKQTQEEYLLGNYDRYNYLDEYSLEGQNLTFVLRDTSVHHLESVDTFQLNINDVKYKIK